MNKGKILIVPHHLSNMAGSFVELMKNRGFEPEFIDFNAEEPVNFSLKNYKALLVMGGMESANSSSPGMTKELNIIKDALALEMPYLGTCLGLQTLVKAIGG